VNGGIANAVLFVGVAAVAVWCYLLAARGGFWKTGQQLLAPDVSSVVRYVFASGAAGQPPAVRVAVVIPARNEAEGIGRAIASLLAQSFADACEIVVVDDASTDGTAEVARAAAREAGAEARLTVLAGQPLPPGWTGKLWAVEQGIAHATRAGTPLDFLLLTDADVVHAPDSLATLVAVAEDGGYDLTSVMVKLACRTHAERLLVPAFVFFFFLLYPPRWITDGRRRTAGAAGGCMLVRPAALQAAGGMAAIRSEIIDDCALAALLKRHGGRVKLGLVRETVSLRSYASCGEIGHMIARTAFHQLRHSAALLAGALAGLVLTFVAPVAWLLLGLVMWQLMMALLGLVAWLLMFITYRPMVRFYGLSSLWALTLPAAAVFYMGATVVSALRYWSGRGGQWKGRAQDAG
jgi:hopene-associated glycosyltransferase HpnB